MARIVQAGRRMRGVVLLLGVWLACAAPAAAQQAAAQAGGERIGEAFIDRFQSFDDQRWQASDRWPSETLFSAAWRPSQVQATPAGLAITLAATPEADAPKPYMSGEISTHGEFRYGYFETRMRAVRGGGIVSGFFTFALPPAANSENEIDMEITGNAITQIELVYHVNGRHIRQIEQLGFDASEDFHTYAFAWRGNSIRWYIDNRLVHVSREHVDELIRPQQIFTSMWNSVRMPRWLGPFDPAGAPHTMTVACIAYAPRYSGRALC
jgi:beta-glucanase (GH16 family)